VDASAGPDICLVSGADEIRLRSYINHSIYARLFDLDYRLECGLDEGVKTKFFYKTSIIKRVLPRYDWVVWLDDDAYITDFSRDNFRRLIVEAEAAGQSVVIADGPVEPNGFWSVVNTGVMCLKRSPEVTELLEMMDDEHLDRVRDWWQEDQHGTFTGGDQDLFVWWMQDRGHQDRVMIVDHRELNSRAHFYGDSLSDAFVMQFCGYPDKKIGVVDFAARFGIGQELVPDELLDRFSSKVRNPMSRPEIVARTQRWRWRGRLKPYLKPVRDRWRARKKA
jgi:hypothetical protein